MVEVNNRADRLEKLIDSLLVEGKCFEAVNLLQKDKNIELAGYNQKIYILYVLSRIERNEMSEDVSRLIFEGRSVQEIIKLYRIIGLYLRRIEFDFPLEYQIDFLNFILEEQISIFAIISIINCNTSIIQKDKVINGFKQILESVGEEN